MLTTPAFAQSAGGIAEGGFGLLPIIFVMVIFYFLLIRPQQKRAKQHKEMLAVHLFRFAADIRTCRRAPVFEAPVHSRAALLQNRSTYREPRQL